MDTTSSPAAAEEGELEDIDATQAIGDTSSAAPILGSEGEEDGDQPTQLLGKSALMGDDESDDGDIGDQPTQALDKSAAAGDDGDADSADATQRLGSVDDADAGMETQAVDAAEGYDPEDGHDSQSQIQTQVEFFSSVWYSGKYLIWTFFDVIKTEKELIPRCF
jgi:hypothetical protein